MNTEPRWSARELRSELNRYEEELRAAGKARNTINTYVQHPERFINWLEGRYRPTQVVPNWRPGSPAGGTERGTLAEERESGPFGDGIDDRRGPTESGPVRNPGLPASGDSHGAAVGGRISGRSSRYDPLRWYLAERSDPVIRLSFAEIERILGVTLPASARQHRAWWANEQAGSHVHARSWLDAGRRTANVDLNAATADFVV